MEKPLAQPVIEERYRIVRRIATGGMATVYLAEHILIGRPVAIKVLHPQYAEDAESVRRFLAEGRTAGTLGHPHIVASTDMGYTATGAPYLVLELLEGSNLGNVIRAQGALPVDRAVTIALQIASAVAAAHARGIIHRDLKSENIFLLERGPDADHVKVLDFGISKFTEARGNTQKDRMLGTPWFMPPEQIEDPSAVDARCDVYGLGAILYDMLSGEAPFADTPFPQVLIKILRDDPPPIVVRRPDVGPELASLVRRAMARSLDERIQSMDDLGAELARLAGRSWPEITQPAHEIATLATLPRPELPLRAPTPPPLPASTPAPVSVTPTPVRVTPAPVRAPTPPPDEAPTMLAAKPALPSVPPVVPVVPVVPRPRAERRGRIAVVAVVVSVAIAIGAGVALWPDGESRQTGAGTLATSSAPVPRAPEVAPPAISPPRTDPPVTTGPEAPDAPAEAAPVALVIESSTRGARATFRGETYRLPMRAVLARGDEPELVEVTVPGHRPRRTWVTLDRDRKLTLDAGRGKRGARREPGELAAAPVEPEPAPPATPPEPEIPTVDEPPPSAKRQPPVSRGPAPGTMDREATRRAVQRHLREIRMCFERGRMDNPQLSGRVLVRIDVAPSGKVTGARVARSDLRSQAVESCITSAVEGWTLPAPSGGVAATITYPFAYH